MATPDPARAIPVKELIERYNRELMETYRQQSPPPQKSWLDEEFPAPDIVKDRQQLAAAAPAQGKVSPPPDHIPMPPPENTEPAENGARVPMFPYTDADLRGEVPVPPQPAPPPVATPPEAAPFEGYLRVFVYTGQTAEPLPGANVTVSRDVDGSTVLFANTVTDRDGLTPVIVLPSVDPKGTMRPGVTKPYVPYTVRVNADGFYTSIYENIPVYGGNALTQPAGLYPLIPGADDTPFVFRSGGPADL